MSISLINQQPKKIVKENALTQPRLVKNCEICGKEFLVAKARRNTARFCSFKCRGEAQSRGIWNFRPVMNVERICEVCGRKFTIHRSIENKRLRRFCSRSCYGKFRSELADKKAEHGKYSKDEACQRAREKNGRRCLICGYDRFIEIAHIIPRSLNGTFKGKNILFLCPNCHRLFDNNLLNFREEKVIEEKVIQAMKLINLDLVKLTFRFRKFVDHWHNRLI